MPQISGLGMLTFGIIDNTLEDAEFGVAIAPVTDANYVAIVALQATLAAAINDLISGNLYRQKLLANDTFGVFIPATEPTAQIEVEWLIVYEDALTHKAYTRRIATPNVIDPTLRLPNSDRIDDTDARWITFQAAFEAVVKANDTGNAVNFIGARLVGKNDVR